MPFILSNGMGCEISLVPAATKQVVPLAQGASDPLLLVNTGPAIWALERVAERLPMA